MQDWPRDQHSNGYEIRLTTAELPPFLEASPKGTPLGRRLAQGGRHPHPLGHTVFRYSLGDTLYVS